MEIPFVKLHGNGNDFILIDEYAGEKIPDEYPIHIERKSIKLSLYK